MSGLQGLRSNMSMSIDQLKDDIVDERLMIIKEYALKGILPVKDLLLSINCIPVDCKDLDRCCSSNLQNQPVAHFEVPQILMDYANKIDGLVVGTGDLSELALGWCTYNGDQMSMYGVNASIPKTLVRGILE